VFISALLNKVVYFKAAVFILPGAQLARFGPEVIPKPAIFRGHMAEWFIVMDSQRLKRRLCPGFGKIPDPDNSTFKFISEFRS
jgi:hypothetical protein